jgi:hypothetical protein
MNTESGEIRLSQMQAIRYIGTYLAKREWIGALITLVFALYIGGFMSLSVDDLLREKEVPPLLYGMTDWIYVTMFPCFGMLMNRTVFAMWKDDFYTKRLAHFRTMPIPLTAILQVRVLQTVIMLPILGALFLLLQYLLSPALRDTVTIEQWAAAGIMWICFSYVVNAFYMYIELGFNGKRYAQMHFIVMLGLAIVVAVLTWQRVYLFLEVLQAAKSEAVALWITFFLLIAVAAMWVSYLLTLRRLRTRSMTF